MQNRMIPVVCICFFLLLVSCATQLVSREAVVTGYVQSAKTDALDNPTKAYIWDGKKEYFVKKNKKGKELLNYIDQKVTAKGKVSSLGEGREQIEIDSYQLVP